MKLSADINRITARNTLAAFRELHTWVVICTMLIVVGGCTTLTKEECLYANWRTIGYEDGVRGHTADRIGRHRRACAEHGVVPDHRAYLTGREEGLQAFCQPHNGYNFGREGKTYQAVCPPGLEQPFLAAYEYGYALYMVQRKLDKKRRAHKRAEEELDEVAKGIQSREQRMLQTNDSTVRARLYNEIKELSEKKGGLENQLRDLDHEITYLRIERRDIESRNPYR